MKTWRGRGFECLSMEMTRLRARRLLEPRSEPEQEVSGSSTGTPTIHIIESTGEDELRAAIRSRALALCAMLEIQMTNTAHLDGKMQGVIQQKFDHYLDVFVDAELKIIEKTL